MRWLAEVDSPFCLEFIDSTRKLQIQAPQLLLINLDIRHLDSVLPADNIELVELSFDISHQLTRVVFELSIVKVSQLIVYFIFYSMQVNVLGLFLQIVFVRLKELLIKVGIDL